MDYAFVIFAAMLPFLMFAARRPPRERHSPEWRSAASPKTKPQFSQPALRSSLTLFHSVSCRLLPLFLRVLSFVFSNLQPLVPKKGGMVGYTSAWLFDALAPVRRGGLCFHNLTNPSYRRPFCLALYFHELTNPFSSKPFLSRSIQNPGGVTQTKFPSGPFWNGD